MGTPTFGLTAYSVSGGVVYETPISLLPVYSSFSSTTSTLNVYVSSNFTHSSVLAMKETGTSGGPYTTISLTSASPTSITTTATSNSTVTRYLGVFVSNLSGGSAFTGADNATLTYHHAACPPLFSWPLAARLEQGTVTEALATGSGVDRRRR